MNRQRYHVRLFSIIASFVMLFSTLGSGVVVAQTDDNPVYRAFNDTEATTNVKLSNRLLDEYSEVDKVTFLVKFKEQAETEKVVEKAKENAESARLTAQKAEHLQRSAVISELKATSLDAQQNVREFIENEEAAGHAEILHSYFIVNGMAVTATKEVAEKIASFPEVEKVLPNETRQLNIGSDVAVAETLKSHSTEENTAWNVDQIYAPEVWEKGFDGSGIVVASIDSGVQWDHPALKENYRGYDAETGEVDHEFSWFDSATEKTEPYDDVGHGTHVTGTMVGNEPDGSNQIGVAPGAKWIAVKAFSDDGGSDADILAAAEWILAPTDKEGNSRVDLAPDIVNNSWSGGPGLDEWYRDVVKEWRHAGIFPAFAAGNVDMYNPGGPGSIANPANYPESFAIGATDKDNLIGEFSLLGPSPYDEIKPDISAPGVNIYSSVPGDNYEDGWNGTSMASPAVSATVSLLQQVNANLSIEEAEDILIETATPLTDDDYTESPNNGYGHGLVDAHHAFLSMTDGLGTVEGKVVRKGDEAPVSGQVNIVDDGRSVKTDPENGSFKLSHEAGEYTAEAEAYGYQSEEQLVTVTEDEVTQIDFTLEEMSKSTLSGTVTNEISGEVVDNISLSLVEDANIKPVETDEKGNFKMTAYDGTYTLKVSGSGYHTKEVEVTFEDDQEINITLDPFFTYPGEEISYDNGTMTNGSMYFAGGAGWAVKMSLPDDRDSAVVTEGLFHFIDKGFSDTSGTDFAVEVWDASGSDGLPGKKLAGPISADAKFDEWTTVDLTEHQIEVDGDFYMVYVQMMDYPVAPGLGTDDGNPYTHRSYQYLDGKFYPAFEDDGNYMIRSKVSYEIESPVITSPKEGETLNESTITVEGTASPTTEITLMNNRKTSGETEVDDDGRFLTEIELTEGENELTAVSKVDGETASKSEPVTVILDNDNDKSELTIDNPKDGDKINDETVTVEGTVTPDNLDYVEVNGQKADVSEEGEYSKRVMLDNGENEINVSAMYHDGDKIEESVTVQVNYNALVIENLTPNEDIYLKTGESIKFEFDSEPGLRATFQMHMPLTNTFTSFAQATEFPMMEMSDGHYVGYWTAPEKAYAGGAILEVKVMDKFNNVSREEAEGKLFINTD